VKFTWVDSDVLVERDATPDPVVILPEVPLMLDQVALPASVEVPVRAPVEEKSSDISTKVAADMGAVIIAVKIKPKSSCWIVVIRML
jgi:hypothetical protein